MALTGLTQQEANKLHQKLGANVLPEKPSFTALRILISQFQSPLIYIIVITAAVSLVLGEKLDALLMAAVVALNITMGFAQEYGAKRTFESLRKIVTLQSTVVRDGKRQTIDVSELVPGDIVFLGSGDRVPADGQLIEALSLYVSEAILTGEEDAVEKRANKDKDQLFMGTTVLSGRGTMRVEKIGPATQIGQIGRSLAEIREEQTPLQVKLSRFAHHLSYIILLVSLFIFLVGIARGLELFYLLRFAIVLSVAAVPEGLPIAVTVILTIGVRRILKQKGLVKKLLSIETLGSTSVICTDKTGTLTEGVMKVTEIDTENEAETIHGLTLLNTRRTSLEIAIWDYLTQAVKIDPQKTIDSAKIIYEEAFESERKFALVVAQSNHHREAFIIGAPDIII